MIATRHPDGSADVSFEPPGTTQLVITLPPSVKSAVDLVLAQTKDDPGVMFGKALGLYMLALQALSRGEHVGATGSADKLDTEFTGF